MKKYFTLFFVLIIIQHSSKACDICGCGTGGSFMGIIPNFGSNQIALRSMYRSFDHPNTTLNYNGRSRVLRDDMYQTEFSYRHFSKNKWSVFINVPYRMNTRFESERTTTISGIGDINASFNYTLLNTSNSMSHTLKHVLMAGVGIKLANGKFMQRDETKVMLPTLFQIGTGANNATGHLYYTLRYQRWGFNLNGLYIYSGKNELEYQIGNQIQTTSSMFWKKDITLKKRKTAEGTQVFDPKNSHNLSILPSIGFNYENSEADSEFGREKEFTGGEHYFGHLSLDVLFERLAISVFYQHALESKVGIAQPENRSRAGFAFTWRL
jgi:hypothetical protein